MKVTSIGMILGSISTIIMFVMKIFSMEIVYRLSWWFVMLPIIVMILGFIAYLIIYRMKTVCRSAKYDRWRSKPTFKHGR